MSRILNEPVFNVEVDQINRVANLVECTCNLYGCKTRTPQFKAARDDIRETGYCAGDWDKSNLRKFEDEPFFKVLDCFDTGASYEKTKAWLISVRKWGWDKSEIVFQKWQRIYNDMRVNGYQTLENANPWNTYILVAISRTGELLFYQGRHRLAMAKRLGIKTIPAKVGIRHKIWHDFRESAFKYANNHRDRVYSPINHLDFATINTKWTDYRGDLILKNINPRSKTVLDLGAHWGYFCDLLSATGRNCVAVEKSPGMFYFLDMISKLHDKPGYTAINIGINEFMESPENGHFDCVIALNIFHHFLKTRKTWDMLVDAVGRVRCNEMFFQMANDKTLGKFGNGWKKTADVIDLIRDKAGLKNVKQIGIEHNRAIYHMTKG